ncbi:thiolase family protein, partial [Cronobacter sakazakii]
MKDVVIVGAARTPIGCFQGQLTRRSAVELGAVVIEALLTRTGLNPQDVDEVILGQVLTAG